MHTSLQGGSCCHIAVQLAASIGSSAKHINAHVDIFCAVPCFLSCYCWSLRLHSASCSPSSHPRAHMHVSS